MSKYEQQADFDQASGADEEEREKRASGVGWGWPGNSRKAHYFTGGRSLCMKWLFFGELTKNQAVSTKAGPDDCATCHKRLAATLPKGPKP